MSKPYRIFGSQMSPYSVKIRAYARYKSIAHQWIARSADNDEDYKKYARLPIVPTLVTPEGEGVQDSTPIIEILERKFPEPAIHPPTPALRFLSALIEEFGDEWGNKLMFHHRWWDPLDQQAAALILARLSAPFGSDGDVAARAAMIRTRMTGRGGFVGSSAATAPQIHAYFVELLDILEPHLERRKYLFGGRPAFADFGLAPQLFEASIDPTCSSIMRARGPNTLDWCYRMNDPREEGVFEAWPQLEETMGPLLAYIGATFLPWSDANARALAAGKGEFSVELRAGVYMQAPQKYHAKSLAALREKFAAVASEPTLRAILERAGCAAFLNSG